MVEVIQSDEFKNWIRSLRDNTAIARIFKRVERLMNGNFGDVKPVGSGISELRIDYGPGYRLYFLQRGSQVVILLCGGDKSTQAKDIVKARAIAENWGQT